jgi:hypothetical protein
MIIISMMSIIMRFKYRKDDDNDRFKSVLFTKFFSDGNQHIMKRQKTRRY